ncbi:MAG: Ig-like domain-containing protein [Nitrospira sp.]
MSLAQLFYLRETFREHVRQWRLACFRQQAHHAARTTQSSVLSTQNFTLEPLEPRFLLSAAPAEILATQDLAAASVTALADPQATLDIDLSGTADALTDGVLITRYLFGFTGTTLTDGAVDPAGQRTDPAAITSYLDSIRSSLDVDLNGQADALTDGVLITRHLFGFTGTTLTDGAVDPAGQRTDPAAIETYLDTLIADRDTVPPVITAGLQQDTGASATDTITNNPTITGSITDLNAIVSFTAGLDSTPVASYSDVLSTRQPDGTFTLSTAQLAQLAGGTLADGTHTLHLRASDAQGNTTTLDRTFTLDTQAPLTPTFDLALTSDTGTVGDQQTTAAVVTLKGQTDPTAQVQLVSPSATTVSNGTGAFQFTNLTLAVGANSFTMRVSDVAGNLSEFTRVLTRLTVTQQADTVLTWNQVMLDAIQRDATAPPVASRGLAMVSLAMYDAISAIDGTPGYYVSLPAQAGTDPDAAAAAAAHRMLSYLYPGQQATFDAQLAASLAAIPEGAGKTNGLTLGQNIANAIIAIRSTDGWNDFVDHSSSTQPGQWQPTGPMFDVALLPQWADLIPFALTSPEQYRPAGPPALDSVAYTAAYNEVKAMGAATGSTRTAEQTEIARFWADGAGTATPPGHWNSIAEQLALQQGNSLSTNARLFAQLNVALADAGITAWNTKYQSNFWRPITAIQQAATDGNASTTADQNWTPLLITPPFPEYISGHSTYSGAAAEILTGIFGANVAFSTTSQGLPGVTRNFTSFEQAAQEAGKSRIYGGIHFAFSNQDGLMAGKSVADFVQDRFSVTTDTQGPKILLTQQSGGVTKTNLTLTGQVLDNLSGVASLQAKLDDGSFAPVSFTSTGNFTFTTALAINGTADGTHTFTFQAIDHQNNQSTLTFTFTLDTKAPTITLTSPANNAALTATTRLTGTAGGTGSKLVTLTYQFDNGTVIPISFDTTTGNVDQALDLSKLSTGAHTLKLTAQDQAGNLTTVTKSVTLPTAIPFTIIGGTPQTGASDVGSTFKPQVFFSRPVNTTTLNSNNFYATDSTGTKLAATIVPAQDGTFAWLFFTNPMPGASTITLHVDGSTILAAGDGHALDADGNGTPGGVLTSTFSTVSLVPLQGTTLSGIVLDPGPDLKMGTLDDTRAGADGILHTDDDVYLNPIAGAKIYILGLENQAVFTDAQGRFSFSAVPSGTIKLAIDGRTATNAPAGVFFPEMVMDLQIEVGQANTVMGTMGSHAERAANLTRPEVYLPRLQASILQTVSSTQNTVVGVTGNSAPDLTAEEAQHLFLTVPPNSAVGTNGQPISDVQIGISTVPPELIRDMLPAGLTQTPNTITIQARGPNGEIVDRFANPLQLTLPNVYNAAPGTKLNFYSFDHTTGRLTIEGTATVSADGLSVTTDPGQGITKPGWHWVTSRSATVGGTGSNDPYAFDPKTLYSDLLKLAVDPDHNLDPAVLSELKRHDAVAQKLSDGYGDYIYDDYSIRIDSLPSGFSKSEFINELLSSINKTVNSADFDKLAIFTRRTPGEPLSPGQIFDIDIYGPDNASVVLSKKSDLTYTFTTIKNNSIFRNGDHVVYGSRDFGFREVDGELQFFTKGVSRTKNWWIDNGEPLIGWILGGLPQDLLWRNFVDGIGKTLSAKGANVDFKSELFNRLPVSNAPDPKAPTRFNYRVVFASGGIDSLSISRELTGISDDSGNLSFVLPSNSTGSVFLFNPMTNLVGQSLFHTGLPGTSVGLGAISVTTEDPLDSDGDSIGDIGEWVVGTSRLSKDSDGDGIFDLAELRSGTDPLGGRALPTGIVSSTPLLGEAKAVVLEGSTTNAETQTAYVATGSYGLAMVDASEFQKPVVLSQLDLPGTATDVAVDTSLGIAAVTSNEGGVHLVDVSNPQQPQLLQTIAVQGSSVEVSEGVAYVAAGARILAYDLLTGESLFQAAVPDAVQELSLVNNRLYALTGTRLHILDVQSTALSELGSVAVSGATSPLERGRSLFVGDGLAYVGYFTGYTIVDVSNPTAPVVRGTPPTTQLAVHDMAVNGSGLAIATTSFAGTSSFAVSLYDVSNPTDVTRFITTIPIPGDSPHIALGAGIAFIAQGTQGLKVVNYLPFDNRGLAPTVTATLDAVDLDAATPGIQVLEGSTVALRPTVTDDVQVRNVELLMNGQVVRNDVAFPFQLSTALPTIAANGSNQVTLQVRATDTGGNVGLTDLMNVQLVPDRFGPTFVASNVTEGSIFGRSFRTVTLTFSEAVEQAKFSSTAVQIINSSGVAVGPGNIQFNGNGNQVRLTFAQQPAGAYTLRIDQAQVSDRAGNVMGTTPLDTHFTIQQFTVEWIGASGGDWNTASNWSTGVVPVATDDVFIPLLSSPVVISSGAVTVQTLIANGAVTLSGGTFAINGDSQINGVFTQSGGTLTGSGNLTLAGPYALTAANMIGTGTTVLQGSGTISSLNLDDDRVVRIVGTTAWTGNTNQRIWFNRFDSAGNGGRLETTGTGVFDVQTEGLMGHWFAGAGQFVNAGVLKKTVGTGTTGLDVPVLNSGTVRVETGTVRLGAGGTHTGRFETTGNGVVHFGRGVHTLEAASAVTGNVLFTGSAQNGVTDVITVGGSYAATDTTVGQNAEVVFNSTGTTGTLTMVNNGILEGSGTLTVTGTHTLTSANMRGSGTTVLQGSGTISSLNLDDDRVVRIVGTTAWTGNTNQRIWFNRFDSAGNGGRLETTGTGVFDVQTEGLMGHWFAGAGQFVNAGVLKKTVGTGTTGLDVPVLNSGTVRVETGTVRLGATSGFTNGGAILIKPGAVVDVSGNYTQTSAASLGIDVAGTATGQFGRMTVTGSAALNGTLNVVLANGFTPTLGNRFRFFTDTSRTGSFAITNGLTLGGGLAFQVDQTDPAFLELVTVAATSNVTTTLASADLANASSFGSEPTGDLLHRQGAWVQDFVSGKSTNGRENEEDLSIALPG